jgi:hypothetical protein
MLFRVNNQVAKRKGTRQLCVGGRCVACESWQMPFAVLVIILYAILRKAFLQFFWRYPLRSRASLSNQVYAAPPLVNKIGII